MAQQVFIGDIETSQYANLYEQNLVPFVETYYNLTVDVNFSNLFATKDFIQRSETDPTNANQVNVRLSYNADYVNVLLGVTDISSTGSVGQLTAGALANGATGKTNGSVNGASSSSHNIATRLLEVVAIHIFGHARARAAIRNDSEYSTSMAHIRNEVVALLTQDKANDFFNQYVNMNKIGAVADIPTDNAVAFNFDDIQLGYRVNFTLTNTLDSNGVLTTLIPSGDAQNWKTNILLKFVHTA